MSHLPAAWMRWQRHVDAESVPFAWLGELAEGQPWEGQEHRFSPYVGTTGFHLAKETTSGATVVTYTKISRCIFLTNRLLKRDRPNHIIQRDDNVLSRYLKSKPSSPNPIVRK